MLRRALHVRNSLRLLVWLSLGADAPAQELTISGTVSDIQQLPIPDATVTLTTAAAAGRRTATTDLQGRYTFNGIAEGRYQLVFERAGFATVTRAGNIGGDGDVLEVSVTMPLAGVITSIDVTDVAGKATASRLDVPDRDIPAQVSSISSELLQQQGVNNMVDALKNASGVQAQRWYGVYEYYTIRGFNQSDVLLVDGLRLEGNRFNTQLNNVESVEVLKGPSSVLYGQGAVGGSINVVRKKPQDTRAYDLLYRGGRFNSHQVGGGATGPVGGSNSLLYRIDGSYDHSDGWRNAGADRVNVSPSLTWLISENSRVTFEQAFNRDRFDGDGGVPINITTLPNFDPSWRFSLPQDNVLLEDSQSEILFNANLSPTWEFRNSFLMRRTSDRYFVTEGIYGDPENNQVFREPLDFHHTRRPVQDTADVVGRTDWLGMHHTVNLGYEYRDHYYRTDVTAGDDPDCTCGYWYLTISPMNLDTLQENTPPLDITTVFRKTYTSFQTQALFWQDQIHLGSKVNINLGGRFDDFTYRRHRIFVSAPNDRVGLQARDQQAYTYRAGIVYSPRPDHQIYFNSSTSFDPVLTIPPDGTELKPRTGRNFEVGYRLQGWNGRVDVSAALYHIKQNNLTVADRMQGSVTQYVQAGEQTASGFDLDINADLGFGTRLLANYGYSDPTFKDFDPFTGNVPRFVQKQAANVWLTKGWDSGITASLGMRYLGPQFTNNSNTNRIGGWTTFSGAVGYRAPQWEWSLNADNLFNRQRYFLGGHFSNLVFPGQPINVFTTIRLRFSE